MLRRSFVAMLVITVGCAPPPDTDAQSSALTTRYGIDYSSGVPNVSTVVKNGYSFVARYLSSGGGVSKNITKAEADRFRADGVDIVVVWENNADDAKNGYSEGVWHAQYADSEARAAGMPSGRPIYFAVDYEPSASQMPAIEAYFDGVASVIGRSRTGIYGGYSAIKRMFDTGKVAYAWQAVVWLPWDPRAQLRQTGYNLWVDGVNCDRDQSVAADFGQWGYTGTTNPPPTVTQPPGAPNAACGAGDANGPNNGTCGVDGRVYFCSAGLWYLKDDCVAENAVCVVQRAGVADNCGPAGSLNPVKQPTGAPTSACGSGDNNGPTNGTCGTDGRVYYCYNDLWHLKGDCVAQNAVCVVEASGVADICGAPGSLNPVSQPAGAPRSACGSGDNNGPNNGTCGTDGRVYYCYNNLWRLKSDCVAQNAVCVVQAAGVADTCGAGGSLAKPPTAACGAGDNNGPNNGMCGPDGRVYYCYQGVWHLKDDCVQRSVGCLVEAAGVADRCTPANQAPTAACGAGDNNLADNGMCGPDGRVYYCYQSRWHLKDDCVANSKHCTVEPAGVADRCL